MRPSNSDRSKAVAGTVLTEVFAVLTDMGYELSTDEMRHLMDRVEARLQKVNQVKNGKEARAN